MHHVPGGGENELLPLTHDPAAADFKIGVVGLVNRLGGCPQRPLVTAAVDVGHHRREVVRTDGIAREEIANRRLAVEVLDVRKAAEECDIRQRHLAWPVGGEGDARVAAGDLEIRPADDRHFQLVVRPHDELGERAGKRDVPARAQAGAQRDHVLLGDAVLKEALGELLVKILRVRRVFHIRIGGDDAITRLAQRDKRHAIRLSRRKGGADLAALALFLHRLLERHCLDVVALFMPFGNRRIGIRRLMDFQLVARRFTAGKAHERFVERFLHDRAVLHRGAVMAQALFCFGAPALDRLGHDRQRAVAVLNDGQLIQHRLDRQRIMAINHTNGEAVRAQFFGEHLAALLGADVVALRKRVAVEDRDDVGQRLVDDVVAGLPDLPFTALTVADDAVDVARRLVELRRRPQAGGDGQALPQAPRCGIKEGESKLRMRMAVDGRVDITQGHRIRLGHRTHFAVEFDKNAQVRARGIDNRHRMPLAQHQPVGRRVAGALRVVAHLVVHEDRDEVAQAHGRRGMAGARGTGHPHAELGQFNGFGVDGVRETHVRSPWGQLRNHGYLRGTVPG